MSRATLALLVLSSCATTVLGTYPGDRVMWDDIISHAEPLALAAKPIAVVAPHHLTDATELADLWSALAHNTPSVVVVIGPDHYAHGTGVTVGARVTFEMVYGPLRTDERLSRGLAGGRKDLAFVGEHALLTFERLALLATGARHINEMIWTPFPT